MQGVAIRVLMAGVAFCAVSARVAEAAPPGLAVQIPAIAAGGDMAIPHRIAFTSDKGDPAGTGEEGEPGDSGADDDGAEGDPGIGDGDAGDDGAGNDGAGDDGAGDDGAGDDGGWTGEDRENCDTCRGDEDGATDDGDASTDEEGTVAEDDSPVWAGGSPDFCEACSGGPVDDSPIETRSLTIAIDDGGARATTVDGGRGAGLSGTPVGRRAVVPDCGAVASGARCGER